MKILLGLDESACSLRAIEFLKQMPWARSAEWRLLSAFNYPLVLTGLPDAMAIEAFDSVRLQMIEQSRWLAKLDRELRAAGFRSKCEVTESDPRTRIVECARDENVDLVVVGSHGRTGMSRLLLGSVAGHVVVHAPCNVLVVKGTVKPVLADPMGIVLGVDESPCSRDAVDVMCALSWPPGARVHLRSVVPPGRNLLKGVHTVAARALREEARMRTELVSRYEEQLRKSGLPTGSMVPEGDARVELESAARLNDADLLVVGSHGRTGLSKLVLGSVASHLVAHAPCSVLVVKRPVKPQPARTAAGGAATARPAVASGA